MVCGIWQKPRGFGNVVLTHVSVPADSTGTHSLYTTYQDYEIMFHVSTLLPYTPNNRQQVSVSIWCIAGLRAFSLPRAVGWLPNQHWLSWGHPVNQRETLSLMVTSSGS